MEVIQGYETDQFFVSIRQALDGNWPKDAKEGVRLEKLVPMFRMESKRLLYNENLCVPRKSVSFLLDIVQDSRIRGPFNFAETMPTLSNYRWRHKERGVKRYVDGSLTCHQCKIQFSES